VGWSTGLVHLAATSLIIQWLAFIPGEYFICTICMYMCMYVYQILVVLIIEYKYGRPRSCVSLSHPCCAL
jgi:hypothetical protein